MSPSFPLAVAIGLAVSPVASAVEPTDWVAKQVVIPSADAPGSANGAGGVAVAWDEQRGRYILVYEYMSTVTNTGCTGGVWGLGAFTSTDGVTWTHLAGPDRPGVADAIFEPDPVRDAGTVQECVAAHPSLLWDYSSGSVDNDQLAVYFKAERKAVTGRPSSQFTGMNHVVVHFDAAGAITSVDPPSPGTLDRRMNASDCGDGVSTNCVPFGFSNIVQTSNVPGSREYVLLVQKKRSILRMVSTSDTWPPTAFGSVSLALGFPTPAVTEFCTNGVDDDGDGLVDGDDDQGASACTTDKALNPTAEITNWRENELFNPELVCIDDTNADGVVDLHNFQGGRSTPAGGGTSITDGGWSVATSTDGGASWAFPFTAQFQFDDDEQWRHWSALRVGADDYVVWSADKVAPGGPLQIHMTYTSTDPASAAGTCPGDCSDPICAAHPACAAAPFDKACIETSCADGVGNDADGLLDCADPECAGSPDCGEAQCDDGTDDDLDGFTDCADSECFGVAPC